MPAQDPAQSGRDSYLRLTDVSVTSLRLSDIGEPLVSLSDIAPRVLIDDSESNRAWLEYEPDFRVRSGLAERIVRALDVIPEGLCLLVKEALRPAALQEMYFTRRVQLLKTRHPDFDAGELEAEAALYVAPPQVAGHPTGGAIDLTLCTPDRVELDLGCPYDTDEAASEGRCFSFATNISDDVRQNRTILFESLSKQGLVNYPFEWWHWSYGDRYWAAVSGFSETLYGPVRSQSID